MQLIVLALMLMALGKNANLKEIKPILESIGGEQATDVIKQAEELNSVISAVQSFATLTKAPHEGGMPEGKFTPPYRSDRGCGMSSDGAVGTERGYSCAPLAPISHIADEDITRCLSQYIALGE